MLPFFAVSVLVAAGAPAQAPSPAPKTILTTEAPIRAFAQDGGRVAWASQCRVRIRALASKRKFVVGGTGLRSVCFEDDSWSLALGGTRTVWGGYYRTQSNNRYGAVLTGSVGGKQRKLADLEQVERSWGGFLTGIEGDGPTLAYSSVYVRQMSGPDCPPCFYRVTGSPVRRVTTGHVVVPTSPPSVAIAVAGKRIAVVPAERSDTTTRIRPQAVPNGPVEIRDASSGALVTTFSPRGLVAAVALSADVAAVLVRDAVEPRIELHSAVTGALIESLPAFPLIANELALSGDTLGFRIGRDIFAFDSVTRQQIRVVAAASPIGLSLEGSRLAWAENVRIGGKLRGRVRAVTLPG